MVQFWVGEGVVVKEATGFYPTIASSAGPHIIGWKIAVPTGEYSFLGRNFREIKVVTRVRDEE